MRRRPILYVAILAMAGLAQLLVGEATGTHSLRFSAALSLVAAAVGAGIEIARCDESPSLRGLRRRARMLGMGAALLLCAPASLTLAAVGMGSLKLLFNPATDSEAALAWAGAAVMLLMGLALACALACGLWAQRRGTPEIDGEPRP